MKSRINTLVLLLLVFGIVCLMIPVALAQDATPVPATTEEAEVAPGPDEETVTEEGATADEAEVTPDLEGRADPDIEATPPAVQPGQGILDTEVVIAIEPTGDNGYCTICHSQPLRTQLLADGSILNLYVNPDMIRGSVHGPSETSPGLGCLDCHGEDAFPHSGPPPASSRQFTLDSVGLCTSCHVDQGEELSMGLHAQAIENGNLEAAVCADCHDAHHVQSAESFPDLVAGVCGDCHENTLAEWQISPHNDIGPLGCASCHDYHAQTLRSGATPTEMCLTCHSEMPEVYTHEVHLNVTDPIACESCHMYRGDGQDEVISILNAENTGHSMIVETVPCTTCHEELESSGEWERILLERFDMEAPPVDAEADVDAEAEAEGQTSSVPLIQGLLVGLGLGVTFTIIFITRSLRNDERTEAEESE